MKTKKQIYQAWKQQERKTGKLWVIIHNECNNRKKKTRQ